MSSGHHVRRKCCQLEVRTPGTPRKFICRMASDKIEFCVLYTHQKTKKSKTWQDGSLIVNTQGTRATLLDDKGSQLDALFIRSEQVSVGSELESERYLITVEEKSSMRIPKCAQPKQEEAHLHCELRQEHQLSQQACHPRKRLPLKRKRMGFIVPRLVSKRPAMDNKDDDENIIVPPTAPSKPCTEAQTLPKASLFSTPGSKNYNILERVLSLYDAHKEGTPQQSADQNACIAAVTPGSDPMRSRPLFCETGCQRDLTTTSCIDESFAPLCPNIDTPQCDYRTRTCSPFGGEVLDGITTDSIHEQHGHQMQVLSPHPDNQDDSYVTDQKENIPHSAEEMSALHLQANSVDVEDGRRHQNSGGKRSASQILALLGTGKGKFQTPLKPQSQDSENKEPLHSANSSQEAVSFNSQASDKPRFDGDVDVMAIIRQKDDVAFDSYNYPLRDQTNSSTAALQSVVPQSVSQECPNETAPDTTVTQAPDSVEKDNCSQPVPQTQARCRKRRGFQNPTMTVVGEIILSSGRSICGELFFPSAEEVEGAVSLRRQVEIPVSFSSVAVYKQVFTSALKEHLNIILFELSQRYHSAKDKADLQHLDATVMLSQDRLSGSTTSPHCDHGNPAKVVCVKKEGANKGRLFYACGAPRASQCKFFQWADQFKVKATDGSHRTSGSRRPSLLDPASATVYFKSHNVHLYYGCEFLRKSTSRDSLMPGAPAWIRKRKREMMEMSKKKLYLRLSRKESSSVYGKDDIWVISKDLTFDPRSTFLARSVYHGPSSSNDVEIEPLSGYSTSNWASNCIVHALLACNACSELSCLKNLQEHINTRLVPILPVLLSNSWKAPVLAQSRLSTFRCPAPAQNDFRSLSCCPQEIEQVAADMIKKHNLNMDQAAALRRVAMMFEPPSREGVSPVPVTLIHGVFGAGKSFLLAVTVLFLIRLFELNDAQQPDSASQTLPWKLLIASTTNVAVDRILLGLLELGFEDFIRVGSIKKIAKPVLPYSVHASEKDSQEIRDLYEMLKTDLTPTEKHHVRRSIDRERLGRNKDLLGRVKVIGATCAACTFPCMGSLRLPVVLLDECSQMTEPSSLLPIARFQCEKLVLVGDPKQLDPTIQGSEAGHDRGLEQTLFNRLILLGHEPILLRTQYRCHPHISAIANSLFYDEQLIDGVSAEDRPPLAPSLPTLCFYSVSSGKECCASDGSYYNDQEASYVVFMIETLVLLGVDPADIGIITLYKAQVVKINMLLQSSKLSSQSNFKAIQISTVDAFQGGEKGVIILSCVRTDYMGFADSDKRTNVALTRSKNHLFIVGNLRILTANKLWGEVIEKCRDADDGIQSSQAFMKEWSPRLDELLQELGTARKRNRQKQELRNSEKHKDERFDCQQTKLLQDSHGEPPSGDETAQGDACTSNSSPSYSPLSGMEESEEDTSLKQDRTPCFDIGDLHSILE